MSQQAAYPSGTDLRLLLQECRCGSDVILKPEAALPRLREAIRSVGFQDLTEAHFAFDDGGYTQAVVLAESHLVIHTWPEFNNLVLVDISVCNYLRPNRERTLRLADAIREIYQPVNHLVEESNMIPRIMDKLAPGHGYWVDVEKLVDSRNSEFQSIVAADTPVFGRAMAIDGVVQVSEADSAFYHEPLVHVPLLALPRPETVLICGGGDGVAAKDALRHPSVERVVIVDIDREVIEMSRENLSSLNQGALDDPRVELAIEDASAWLRGCNETFDAILIDSTDPVGCGESLFTPAFYANLRRALADDGRLSLHVGSPYVIEKESKRAVEDVMRVFERADAYLQYVPSYASVMGFLMCQKGDEPLPSPETLQERIESRGLGDLELISPDTFQAMFAIPPRLYNVFPQAKPKVIA